MTSATLSPLRFAEPQTESAGTTTAPRKRRRRAGTTGAADDCFTCRKRSVKCDRKRPYCSSCIDNGKECGGYKTTLTWGVGVASRGKLRGMSCPIANKNIDGSDATPAQMASRRRTSSATKVKRESAEVNANPLHTLSDAASMAGAVPIPRVSQPETCPNQSMPIEIPQAQAQAGWNAPGYQEHVQAGHSAQGQHYGNPGLDRIQTSLEPPYGSMWPGSATSMNSYTESEYQSPMEYPHTPNSMHFPDTFQYYQRPYEDHTFPNNSADSLSLQCGSYGSYADSLGSSLDGRIGFDGHGTVNPTQTEVRFNNVIYNEPEMNLGTVPEEQFDLGLFGLIDGQHQVHDYEHKDLSLINTRFGASALQFTPRLRTLLDYYDRNVCPFLVAFDGPTNPYRMHVLQLAMQNEGLQNAIAALATNNMRMRKKEPQRIDYIEELDPNNEPTPEETCYKSISIDQLNVQLSDPRAAQDDSVLATLLVLCLFHVCDSGFSKFKTQLAGVQKLLSMRDPILKSEFTGWIETFFTWFDVMTSTVNDRETEIRGDSLDMLDFSANLGALEHFSGCDGRLFKIIARLGRLNLLSQNRPVRDETSEETPRASPRPTTHHPLRPTKRPFTALDYSNLDGNGWRNPIIPAPNPTPSQDPRHAFWTEWHTLHHALQTWSPSSDQPLTPSQKDLDHISQAFRSSALLYTTRLAHPHLPPTSPILQTHVQTSLYHITALEPTSCVNKFLLWPLFITGTECVHELGQRAVVRERCIEVQRESGFFNNLSGLGVLERVWRDMDLDMDAGGGVDVGKGVVGQQAFKWRRAMGRGDGEYILI